MFADADLLEMHRRMLVIRGFEERVAALYRDGEIPGFVHLSIGQEASAVGACWPLRRTDVITSTHRGHGHCLAKGLAPPGMSAGLLANDVVATAAAMHEVVAGVRAGRGPAIVEAATYRWHGHYEGDPQRYRSPDEVQEWEGRDPLLVHARQLHDAGIDEDTVKALAAS